MLRPKYVRSEPLLLTKIDNDDDTYLRLTFSDGVTRKMAKGGKWPSYLAVELHKKAEKLLKQKVVVVTSQTTKAWEPKKWLCNIYLPKEVEEKERVEAELGKKVLWVPSETSCSYIEYTFVQDVFRDDPDLNDFESSLAKEFDSSWRSSKHGRMVDAGLNIKRLRIGKRDLSKRQGYRVTVFEAHEGNGWSYFIILQVDEKLKDVDRFPDKSEMIARAKELIQGERSPEKIHQIFEYLATKRTG